MRYVRFIREYSSDTKEDVILDENTISHDFDILQCQKSQPDHLTTATKQATDTATRTRLKGSSVSTFANMKTVQKESSSGGKITIHLLHMIMGFSNQVVALIYISMKQLTEAPMSITQAHGSLRTGASLICDGISFANSGPWILFHSC